VPTSALPVCLVRWSEGEKTIVDVPTLSTPPLLGGAEVIDVHDPTNSSSNWFLFFFGVGSQSFGELQVITGFKGRAEKTSTDV
jgi:hypothetical protein